MSNQGMHTINESFKMQWYYLSKRVKHRAALLAGAPYEVHLVHTESCGYMPVPWDATHWALRALHQLIFARVTRRATCCALRKSWHRFVWARLYVEYGTCAHACHGRFAALGIRSDTFSYVLPTLILFYAKLCSEWTGINLGQSFWALPPLLLLLLLNVLIGNVFTRKSKIYCRVDPTHCALCALRNPRNLPGTLRATCF